MALNPETDSLHGRGIIGAAGEDRGMALKPGSGNTSAASSGRTHEREAVPLETRKVLRYTPLPANCSRFYAAWGIAPGDC